MTFKITHETRNNMVIILTASRYIIGIHIEYFTNTTSKTSRNRTSNSSQWRTLISNRRNIEYWFNQSTSIGNR